MSTAAVLLSGGRASRVGGAAKPLFEVDGRSLLRRALDAVDGCRPVVVAGPRVAGVPGVRWARERPPFGGPAAAVVTALACIETAPAWTVLLACDLPGAGAAVRRLSRALADLPPSRDGVCLADADGQAQWLIGVYRTPRLRAAAGRLPDGGRDASMRGMLGDLAIAVLPAPEAETADVDTWEDLARARERVEEDRR